MDTERASARAALKLAVAIYTESVEWAIVNCHFGHGDAAELHVAHAAGDVKHALHRLRLAYEAETVARRIGSDQWAPTPV